MRARMMTGVACLTVLLTTACGGGTAGEPKAGESEQPSTTEKALPNYGAPPVPTPLDVSGIAFDPCEAITKQQANSFPGTLSETDVSQTTLTGKGKSCGWIFQGKRYGLGVITGGVVLPAPQYQGLSSIYRVHQRGGYSTFREVGPIAGYPAVVYASGQTIGDGYCRLSVGLRDDTAYRITTGLDPDHPANDTPCQAAKKLARLVVQNLKDGR